MNLRRQSAWLSVIALTTATVSSVPTGAQPIHWENFLKRSDPVWATIPQRFDHGTFAGNGTLGLTIFQDGPTAIRFAMGRNDVTSHAHDNTRLLMGGFCLATHGTITGGELRTDLWNAEIRGTIKTETGRRDVPYDGSRDPTGRGHRLLGIRRRNTDARGRGCPKRP